MTIEELKELKKTVRAGFYIDDTDGDEEFFRVINQSDEIRILELIDEKISQLSVTDEDVSDAITQLEIMASDISGYMAKTKSEWAEKKYNAIDLAITALNQMHKEPCEYCEI